MRRILAVLVVLVAPAAAGAQEFDDPAVTVCELLVRPEYEIERNAYRRVSASILGSKAILDFEWGVAGAKPKLGHVECPFRFADGGWVFDSPPDGATALEATPGYPGIIASGLYPIPESDTALGSE